MDKVSNCPITLFVLPGSTSVFVLGCYLIDLLYYFIHYLIEGLELQLELELELT